MQPGKILIEKILEQFLSIKHKICPIGYFISPGFNFSVDKLYISLDGVLW